MSVRSTWPFDDKESAQLFNDLLHDLHEARDRGVAFFGAGVSVPAGLPTWIDFHRNLLEHFDISMPSVEAGTGHSISTDIDFIANRDHAALLSYVKRRLGRPIASIPPLLKTALSTRAFRYYYTTNVDECLSAAASGKAVSSYPDYMPMDARFVYLHGRASTANSIHDDLVLGTKGYKLAYDDSIGVSAKNKLRQLAPYPVVFRGFSMKDAAVVSSLAEMAHAARLRRVIDANDQVAEEFSELKWYSIEIAPNRQELRRKEDKRERSEELRQFGVRTIWYQDGGSPDPYRAALEIVQRLRDRSRELSVSAQDESFVESLLAAEELASVPSPSASQVRQALAIVNGQPRIAAAFWDGVDGADWFRRLRDAGVLDPRSSFVTPSGERRAPLWQAAGFLKRVAAEASAEVADYLLTIDTDNWAAVRAAFDVLEALDEPSGATAAPHLAKWIIQALPIDPMLLYQVAESSRQLDAEGKPKVALALLQATLRGLANSGLAVSEGASTDFSATVAPILGRYESNLDDLQTSLQAALLQRCGSPDDDDIRYSRPAIEPHRMNRRDHSAISLLIDVLRDTLLHTEHGEVRASAVERLIASQWPTERRLGIAHCFLKRSDLPSQEARIITPDRLADQHLFHELAKLIADSVADLSEASIRILKEFACTLHSSTSEAERVEYQFWARVLPVELLPEPIAHPVGDAEDAESHLFRGIYYSETFTLSAPLDFDGFSKRAAELTLDELIALVRDPASAGVNVSFRHDQDEMWSLLAQYAKVQGLLEPLLSISKQDLGNNRVWRAIEAMPEVAGSDSEQWTDILDWADGMESELEPDQLWPIGRLLDVASKTVPLCVSERVHGLAMRVMESTKRSTIAESSFTEDTILGGFLNQPSGNAVQALLELLRREIVEFESSVEPLAGIPQWFKSALLDPLDRDPTLLGIDAWIGVGRFYGLICARAPESVDFVSRYLSSSQSESSVFAIGFWAGYLWAPLVSTEALERLREAYRRNLSAFQTEDVLESDLRDRFYSHIVIGVLREVPGYDDMLLETLGSDFTAETRGSIAFALGSSVQQTRDEASSHLHENASYWFQRYWTEHVERVGGQDGTRLATYLRWLGDVQLSPSEINESIQASLAQATDGFEVRCTFEYLEHYPEQEPLVVLEILDRCVGWYRLHHDFWLDSDKVRALLDRLTTVTRGNTMLRDVLDGLAELGAISPEDVRRYLGEGPT